MADYLSEVNHAVSVLIAAIWSEREQIKRAQAELDVLTRRVNHDYVTAESMQATGETADDVMAGVGRYWENYFGADKERHAKDLKRARLEEVASTHAFSIGSLSGALLQHAKQGISLVHAGLAPCPPGRMVLGVNLKNLVWQGRNQAIHWDEGLLRAPVQACFNMLAAGQPRFATYSTRNCAFDVVDLLGWTSVSAFVTDMQSLE